MSQSDCPMMLSRTVPSWIQGVWLQYAMSSDCIGRLVSDSRGSRLRSIVDVPHPVGPVTAVIVPGVKYFSKSEATSGLTRRSLMPASRAAAGVWTTEEGADDSGSVGKDFSIKPCVSLDSSVVLFPSKRNDWILAKLPKACRPTATVNRSRLAGLVMRLRIDREVTATDIDMEL